MFRKFVIIAIQLFLLSNSIVGENEGDDECTNKVARLREEIGRLKERNKLNEEFWNKTNELKEKHKKEIAKLNEQNKNKIEEMMLASLPMKVVYTYDIMSRFFKMCVHNYTGELAAKWETYLSTADNVSESLNATACGKFASLMEKNRRIYNLTREILARDVKLIRDLYSVHSVGLGMFQGRDDVSNFAKKVFCNAKGLFQCVCNIFIDSYRDFELEAGHVRHQLEAW